MTVFDGVVLYVLIWWTVLFAVLPFGTQSVAEADPLSGWRGAPVRPRLLLKALATTLVAALVWGILALVITSPWLSFRHGWLSLPTEKATPNK